ncbi:riboflavin kinase-like isoform X2 [Varroa destructor]|uniref:riboflavin kinase n=1 Tax=Varroa destructor TaxID=109461 RepID=A0A7M7JQ88_VARDE|nr:riboflavin kinase-like isoform X2 [Varroa destructor]
MFTFVLRVCRVLHDHRPGIILPLSLTVRTAIARYSYNFLTSCIAVKHLSSANSTRSSANPAMKPVYLTGTVIHGRGRGASGLGCPTANIDEISVARDLPKDFKYGIYYGWAKLMPGSSTVEGTGQLFKMAASVGTCPFFRNESLSVEVHLIHKFPKNFYGATLKVVFLGYLRGEKDYNSVDELIAAIRKDIEDAKAALDTVEAQKAKDDPFFSD